MKYFFLLIIIFTSQCSFSQLTDNFEDGNFTSVPTWIGDDSVFTIVDVSGNKQLRSNKLLTNSSYYLSTASTVINDAQWEFFTNLQFNTSSANYVDIFLCSDQSDLFSAGLNGYFVRIGGTTDEISLYKKVAGVNTKIIDGTDGTTNSSNSTLKIKITCTSLNDWKLERDLSGTGDTYFIEGTVNDATIATSAFFGIAITHSTASFIQKHFFDDIYVGPIIYDLDPPVLISATAISDTQIDVLFNEPLDQISAENTGNYDIQPFQSASVAVLDGTNPALVHITPAFPLANGGVYTLFSFNIEDLNGNVSSSQSTQFSYFIDESAAIGDVIINEFMADPSPIVGLPEIEYVEIYNKSSKYFNLNGWKIGDGSGDGTIQSVWISPGEYKVLCPISYIDSFPNSVGVSSFPSYNNAGDNIILKDDSGLVLDFLNFTDDWYNDPLKQDGGFSLELINPNDPCTDENNWTASSSTDGGTPGLVNSVYDLTPDSEFPQIEQLITLYPNALEIHFSEGMDSTLLADAPITISPFLTISSRYISGVYPTMMTLLFVEALQPSQYYQIELTNVGDCWLNTTDLNGQFILPDSPDKGDIIINEILFDPLTGGYDWIEVYNTSAKVIDLKDWVFANYDDSTISNEKTIPVNFLIEPEQYAVIGSDSTFVKQNYPFSVPGTFVNSELPSYNNDSSTVYLIFEGELMDKVSYTSDWHFALLDKTDGVSLERIDFEGESDNINNWHSASEAVGFATPGGENSQFMPAVQNGDFSYTNSNISPDNDGYEDVLQINYQMSEPGLLGTFTIYDERGRKIIELFNNELLGTSGTFKWDGLNEDGTKVSIGTYVGVFESFALDGGLMFTKRKAFVVAGKL